MSLSKTFFPFFLWSLFFSLFFQPCWSFGHFVRVYSFFFFVLLLHSLLSSQLKKKKKGTNACVKCGFFIHSLLFPFSSLSVYMYEMIKMYLPFSPRPSLFPSSFAFSF
ncbi:hypothetical protein STCU_10989 [Strigomonas culicis]|uniref:Uncharacterized protein n=1 Tax=Strigomonas culicis TaxID=28005 RepID=S9TFD6_9TRYP|nr:hypothetical protein STCU_10989 [Strigomonas culicis]|eukprot:EPY16787.1 hypothetical protein STCU_10989 [Strigomonas culicis]